MALIFGKRSIKSLNSSHPDLTVVMKQALSFEVMDFCVIEGHRNEKRQNWLFEMNKSQKRFPHSKHNKKPSEAVDIAPWVNGKISWYAPYFHVLSGVILAAAKLRGVEIRWGGNWNRDLEPLTDQTFQDLGHFEVIL